MMRFTVFMRVIGVAAIGLGFLASAAESTGVAASSTANPAGGTAQPTPPPDTALETSGALTAPPLRIQLSVYSWLSSLTNDVKIRNSESSSDAKFTDILKTLDFANFAHLEIQKGKWGGFAELDFIKLSGDTEYRTPDRGLPFKTEADGVLKQTTAELGAIRSFEGSKAGLDVMAGGRYFRMVSDVHAGLLRQSSTVDFLDPMIGARLRLRLSDKWGMSLRSDIAGFDVGSKLTTNIVGTVSYTINDRYSVGFGYRYMDMEYKSRAEKLSTTTYGPLIGITIKF